MLLTRRRLLHVMSAAAAVSLAGPASARTNSEMLMDLAHRELARLGSDIPVRDVVGIADYSQPSSRPRFHLVDMQAARVSSYLVSHGRGSDPAHSGYLQRFSDQPGSNASSEGAYRTSDYYRGRHGRSMRLIGLDDTNRNAHERAIVVHGAWYVSEAMVRQRGLVGRSQGCFAFAESDLDTILARLGPGRLLVSTRI